MAKLITIGRRWKSECIEEPLQLDEWITHMTNSSKKEASKIPPEFQFSLIYNFPCGLIFLYSMCGLLQVLLTSDVILCQFPI